MTPHTTPESRKRIYHYYSCKGKYKKGPEFCSGNINHRAEKLESRIWDAVSNILKDPEQLRADLDTMIELERGNTRGDPFKETKLWADKLAEVDRKRARYQEMAAADLITFDELRTRLTELDDTRKIAERELEVLRNRNEYLEDLEREIAIGCSTT
jgi:hypothetical protein